MRRAPDIDALRRHLRQKPDDGRAWMALAGALLEQPASAELSHAVAQCLRHRPDDHQAWLLAATMQQRVRGPEAALQWLEHAASRSPNPAAPLLALARLRLDRFQLVEALAAVNRAIEIAGTSAAALQIRGDINLQGTHWDEALADYRQLEQSGMNDAKLMHQIGCCHFGLDDQRAAEAHFRKALARDPQQLESRFTLALSYYKRMESDKAEATLAEVARAPGGDSMLRHKADVALAVLAEHRRLQAPLGRALASGSASGLQASLNEAPDALQRQDPQTLERFRRLASIFREQPVEPASVTRPGKDAALAFLEAVTLSAAETDATKLAALYRVVSDSEPGGSPGVEQDLLAAWQCVRDRAAFDPSLLYSAEGEAWLRYWHARLLHGTPQARPGQFKAVDAALPGKPQIGPEFVVPLCRALLGELLPSVPAGLARGVFLYVALRVLQPFGDGNSRLARFLMNGELQAAGLAPVVIPASWSSRMNAAFDPLLFQGRLDPLAEALAGAQAEAADQARALE